MERSITIVYPDADDDLLKEFSQKTGYDSVEAMLAFYARRAIGDAKASDSDTARFLQ